MEAVSEKINFKRYPVYQESEVDWIGQIPQHWNIKPVRAIFEERNEKNIGPKTDFILSVTKDRGVIPYDEKGNIGNNKSEDIERYKIVHPNDLVINKMNVIIGSLGLSKYYGALSQVYIVLQPKTNEFSISYYSYLFSNEAFYKSLIRFCTGIMELRESLNKDEFKKIRLPLPPIAEQTAIANFLDHKTTQIDKAIAQKEKLIELLKERRQILIYKAVARGLNENMRMKDSGVEWIGEIPEHWQLISNRSLFDERNEPGNDKLPILSVSIHTAVSDDEVDEDENIRGRIRIADKEKYKLVRPNDIVFNMMRAWQGAIGAVRVNGMVSPAYIVAKPKGELNSDYFEYLCRTASFIQQIDRSSKGITDFRKRLYWNEFKQLLTVLPPVDEQNEIVDFIKKIINKTDVAIEFKQKEIEKLKEYKATLINTAVTGKIKVY